MAKRMYNKHTTQHMCASISGLMSTTRGSLTYIERDGKTLTDPEARLYLNRLQAEGHEVIPCTNKCYRFDKKKGCPGHIKSLKPLEEPYVIHMNKRVTDIDYGVNIPEPHHGVSL